LALLLLEQLEALEVLAEAVAAQVLVVVVLAVQVVFCFITRRKNENQSLSIQM
jgi:hypothetical protein